nr:MAG TPA: hypothetical protein [Caudoviricetes sp.]
MTYGEKIIREKEKMQMKNGVFVIGVRLPPRMNFDKAMKYYGEKLDRYWLSKIELSPASKFSKQDVLQILKGKNLNGVSDDNG